jgi:hypothetical protein
MMSLPILWNHINFDIARTRFFQAELKDGSVEIRPGSVIPETGVKHANWLAVGGAEVIAAETLVVPDVLQQTFWRMRGIAFAQEGLGLLLRAPLSVKVRPERGHGA